MSDESVVLQPSGSQWDSRRRKRRYEGSSLQRINGRLEWTGPQVGPADWQLTIGMGAGEAAKVVRVLASFNDGFYPTASTHLDRYAVLDAADTLVAWFPSTVDVRPFPDALAWYTETAVEQFTQRAGLEFGKANVDSARELAERFPGLFKQAPWFVVMEYVLSITVILGGFGILLALLRGDGNPSGAGSVLRVVLCWIMLGVIGVGVLMFPDVYRRIPQRRDQPASADPRRDDRGT